MSIFDHPAFDPRHEVKVHVLMLVIAIVIAVLSIVRMTQPVPFTRGQIIGITMSLKTVLSLKYQLIVGHVPAFRKWRNLFVFAALNIIEVYTWPVAVALMYLGIAQVCIGDSCALQKAAAALAVVILVISIQPAISSTLNYLYRRRYNAERGQERPSMYEISH